MTGNFLRDTNLISGKLKGDHEEGCEECLEEVGDQTWGQ